VLRLGFGCAVGNSSGQWGVMEVVSEVESGVVWLRWWWWGCVSANARQEGGLRPNPTKPSVMAWFRVRRAKRHRGAMGGGGGMR